jgi:hypothetical protein
MKRTFCQDRLGTNIGKTPQKKDRFSSGGCCHGPHLFEEWWIGPQSGDAADTRGWRRPFRNTHGAPHDEPLMAQPVPFDNMASSLLPPPPRAFPPPVAFTVHVNV